MSDNKQLSREETAKREIGVTVIGNAQKMVISGLFLAVIFIYPAIQYFHESRTAQTADAGGYQPLSIVARLAATRGHDPAEYNRNLVSAVKEYENTLEDTSLLRYLLLSPAQQILTGWAGTGNEKVIVGADGWLFFSADFNYLANPGFLRPERLHKRRQSGIQPDPVRAILDFDRQLKARGISLLLLPVPVKPMLYGDKLGGSAAVLQNQSYRDFAAQLEANSIKILDLSPALDAMRRSGGQTYLKTDTHWTPDGMDLAAKRVAAQILGVEPPDDSPVATTEISGLGDIVAMLKLNNSRALFPLETIRLRDYRQSYARDADILLLGDSFTNIYDIGAMNWGSESGFGRALMYYLKRPVDVIARNDAGAYATRQLLANELKSGNDRLRGKTLVIYEFAIRELADGDWKMLDLTLGNKIESKFLTPSCPQTVTGEVIAVSAAPRPGTAPYKDHVMSVHLGKINGAATDQALVYIDSMRDNVLQPASSLKAGDTIKIELSPWADYETKYSSWPRSDLDDAEVMLQEPCWGKLTK